MCIEFKNSTSIYTGVLSPSAALLSFSFCVVHISTNETPPMLFLYVALSLNFKDILICK